MFLWPENWIEPELKKDRSQFFKDLENELLQNEINQYTVETAFSNYLEKLDGVAQLEIAGFYQEDDGDNAIVHVFGRTTGPSRICTTTAAMTTANGRHGRRSSWISRATI